ncbi:TlpA disulfide reductase family protein [Odoribacter sp. AF15-53]|uniref:TlpA family protein disulfide reductase n=1 Tax=Odoribacter sp. AF15-53 TaxID=2292236 RepID=UPI001F3F0309|nr:TlpA disulfide reductase family protein [Odoribacter sp. AF15-53]
MLKMIKLCSLLFLLCFPLLLSAQEVKEKIDTTQPRKAMLKMVLDAIENQSKEAGDKVKNELLAGMTAPDFEFPNQKGKVYSLKDFRGKYVYIDVWATWCDPCCQEIPFLKKLEKKLSKKKIVFVSLSCDKDIEVWKKMVKKDKLKGIQLCMGKDTTFWQDYLVSLIPRFILLDKEGKFVNSLMTRPSDPETEKTLLALPGI